MKPGILIVYIVLIFINFFNYRKNNALYKDFEEIVEFW